MTDFEFFRTTYFSFRISVERIYKEISCDERLIPYTDFKKETSYILDEIYRDDDDVEIFLLYLVILCYAIRHNKELPIEVKNKMEKMITSDYFNNNIEWFMDDEDYEDIVRDFDLVKEYLSRLREL